MRTISRGGIGVAERVYGGWSIQIDLVDQHNEFHDDANIGEPVTQRLSLSIVEAFYSRVLILL